MERSSRTAKYLSCLWYPYHWGETLFLSSALVSSASFGHRRTLAFAQIGIMDDADVFYALLCRPTSFVLDADRQSEDARV